MSKAAEVVALDRQHVWHPYTQEMTAPSPVPISHAQGATLHGMDGRDYLDLISSWWVTTHGHGHPVIAQAIAQQASQLEQVIFAGFTHEPAVRLASELVKRLPPGLSRVFYSDNGSTAVEAALKMACQYWLNQGQQRTRIVVCQGGYHGDTVGAMSMGRSSGFFDAYESLLFQVDTIPFPATWMGDDRVEEKEAAALKALDDYIDQHAGECMALLVEPLVQGAAGLRMCRREFLQGVAQRLKQAGILLIFDEVMTGFGRTGSLFACQKAEVTPDIICLAKGLTAGFLPVSATVCRQEIYQAFLGETFEKAFSHGHSFTANPIGCAAGVASLQLFETENTLQRIAAIEAIHTRRLTELSTHPRLCRPRITGSIAAFELFQAETGYDSGVVRRMKEFFLQRGMLMRPLGGVIYLLPPYCITAEELNRAWDAVAESLDQVP
ncbi:MAG: adenosylmethionine--8-amino-7-oxononanoate transaminase [Magnetococcales bacterium]|nr:adenosylmethionine--8-amino-7-oxononanoate transaminase [Magnetococcales bacterium]NGZ28958.1 adenosylmethionine--8-amino-7-oxononanoate transaminase [Magnetococcales bacterium]